LPRDEIRALSEVTPWVRLTSADSDLLAKLELDERWGKSVEGHTAGFLIIGSMPWQRPV